MTWDSTYRSHQQVWGDKPSELAAFACKYLQGIESSCKDMEILDLGCGYGRDAMYLARSIKCRVLGIDNSREAIEMARKTLAGELESRVRFECCDFRQMPDGKYDIIFVSNFYQLLEAEQRNALRNIIEKNLKPGGMLFLSTFSTGDPEHFGKGKHIDNEVNSFYDERFLHFCTREELERDFNFLTIKELVEHEHREPRSNGEVHHHVLWLLLGCKPSQIEDSNGKRN